MRRLKALYVVLCAFLSGFALHDLMTNSGSGIHSATDLARWLVPPVLGVAAVLGALKTAAPAAAPPSK